MENHRTSEIGGKEWIEMTKEIGGKRKVQSCGSQENRIMKGGMGWLAMHSIINKIHHYSGKIVLKSAIKIAKLIFLTLE